MKKTTKILLIIAFTFLPMNGLASDLLLLPAEKQVSQNQYFDIHINVSDSSGFDTVRAEIDFDPAYLRVSNIRLRDLLTNLSPGNYIDNETGNIFFGAFKLKEKEIGQGTLATITFEALKTGKTQVKILDSSKVILAGNETANGFGSANVEILSVERVSNVLEKGKVPELEISSPSHADQTVWSQKNEVTLIWNEISNIEVYNYAFSQSPEAELTESLDGVESTVLNNVRDGTWYFILQGILENGEKTEKAFYKVNIDSSKPKAFQPIFEEKEKILRFKTIDQMSGIDFYQVKIDDSAWRKAQSPLILENLIPGEHRISVKAIDRAQNHRQEDLKIKLAEEIEPVFFEAKEKISWRFWIILICVLSLLMILIWLILGKRNKKKRKKREKVKY